jgi:cell division protein FtsL
MTRIDLLLLVACLLTALGVVQVQYESRQLYTAVDRAQRQQRELAIEHEALRAQRRTEAAASRVQRVAEDKLSMRAPDPGRTLYLQPTPAGGN